MTDEKSLTAVEAAYIAGFMDGEGSFMCVRESRPKNRNGVKYRFSASVTNTNYEVMRWVADVTGAGNISTYHDGNKEHKRAYKLRFNKEWMCNIIPQLIDYLIIKKKQAILLLEGIKLQEPPNNYSHFNVKRLYQIALEICALNKTGAEQKYFPFETLRSVVKKDERLCVYPGCTTIHYGDGYCRKHYRRIKVIQSSSPSIDIDSFHNKDGCRVCKECGEKIPTNKYDGALFCNKDCLVAFHARKKRESVISRVIEEGRQVGVCQQCGKNFESKFSSTRYCSDHCRSLSRAVGPIKKSCVQCGETFLAKRHNRRLFCSELCSQRNRAARKKKGNQDNLLYSCD